MDIWELIGLSSHRVTAVRPHCDMTRLRIASYTADTDMFLTIYSTTLLASVPNHTVLRSRT